MITVEEGSGLDNELDVVEGMQSCGYLSPYFINNQQSMQCELDDPFICTTRRSRTSATCRSRGRGQAGKPLLIVAESRGRPATLVVNTIRGIVKVCGQGPASVTVARRCWKTWPSSPAAP